MEKERGSTQANNAYANQKQPNPYGDQGVISSQEDSVERASQGNKKRALVKQPGDNGHPTQNNANGLSNPFTDMQAQKRVNSLNSKNVISGTN